MFPKRIGLVVWVKDLKVVKHLERLGNVHYISRRLKYVMLYVNATELEKKISQIQKQHQVYKVERSYRTEITTDFSNTVLA